MTDGERIELKEKKIKCGRYIILLWTIGQSKGNYSLSIMNHLLDKSILELVFQLNVIFGTKQNVLTKDNSRIGKKLKLSRKDN
jgi:hypothetical protein